MTNKTTERVVAVMENYKYLGPQDNTLESYGYIMQGVGRQLVEWSKVEGLEYHLDVPWVEFWGPESIMRKVFGDERVDQEIEMAEEYDEE